MKRARLEETRDFYAVVGQRIAKARTGRLTQEALAKKATLTRTSIVNIEKGRQQILLHTLVDIAQALKVPVGELIPKLNDNIESILRDKPAEGVEWVMTVANNK